MYLTFNWTSQPILKIPSKKTCFAISSTKLLQPIQVRYCVISFCFVFKMIYRKEHQTIKHKA